MRLPEILWLKVEENISHCAVWTKDFPHQKHCVGTSVIARVHALYRGFHVSLADSTHALARREVALAGGLEGSDKLESVNVRPVESHRETADF